ncbi:hypothetical protein TIFTF001_036706 [Ficus carica]|uniref:Uncharacterized protein n=1 Tax=Ficus carica TaxID=3494 RepID=A0AA88E7F1_FICCA|nr:hypothetical protein TIFTF001_036706 [Ficus carica]
MPLQRRREGREDADDPLLRVGMEGGKISTETRDGDGDVKPVWAPATETVTLVFASCKPSLLHARLRPIIRRMQISTGEPTYRRTLCTTLTCKNWSCRFVKKENDKSLRGVLGFHYLNFTLDNHEP